ncbi:DUF4175 family protein [Mesohalobacter halotolerans]|uniref:DUF4175 family protein n=1 Tax=Mesohalobacter halotolerans TaxID=1883405 RepID=A0A4U5TUG9_9FLAO|nr:DUF4175 family protein [Mesohalobacter halotolerans]TKS57164.1 DUF4175 family protein [Mesohalobacter halotolerans]
MQNYNIIEQKINQYIRKYYINELIKGLILFFSATLFYFIITTALEYLLWLNSIGRAILFWSFVLFSSLLFAKFIVWPIAKLMRWLKGIDYSDASTQIGKHFPEVSDKLTNLLQLKAQGAQDELVIAGIEQKAKDLKPVPFQLAVNLSLNLKYLKFAAIPISIIIIVIAFGKIDLFTDSYKRVVNYQTYYEPPAPFYFQLHNTSLKVVEGEALKLKISTAGEILPKQAKININNQDFFLRPVGNGQFEYLFNQVNEDLNFKFSANGITSKTYQIEVMEVPKILDFTMALDYPDYTQNQNKRIQGQGSINIPEGTKIEWQLKTQATNYVKFLSESQTDTFQKKDDIFTLHKKVNKNLNYSISTSNQNLQDYETLSYKIKVIKDQYPKISVQQKKDSSSQKTYYYQINLTDDYGLKRSQIVYYEANNPQQTHKEDIPIKPSTYEKYFYVFPNENLELKQGTSYKYYFEVFDNDGVNGSKSSQSQVFGYRVNTQSEIDNALLNQQNRSLDSLNSGLENLKKQEKDLKAIEKLQKEKQKFNYSDKQKISNFIKRQKQQRQMMKNYMKSLEKSLDEFQPEENNEDKKALQERIQNNEKMLQQNEDLLKELEKYQNKLDNEKLQEKLDKFSNSSKKQERSLEQLLELTKRYYVEQKTQKIAEDLNELAEKQEQLSKQESDKESETQKQLNKEFDDLQKQLDDLDKENKKLKQPLSIERDKLAEKQVDQAQEDAQDNLEKSESKDNTESQKNQQQQQANQQQKKASEQMKKMAQQMSQSMMSMSAQQQSEDAEMLKQILDNLITFSKEQEALMKDFKSINASNPNFAKKLRRQGQLRENFEHIDDSLFALALRNPMISESITSKLTDIQFDIEKSLERLAETEMRLGTTSQQYVMVNANELANMLDASLDQMQMQMQGSGQGQSGKGKQGQSKGQGFQLSDIIKSHEELQKQMGQKGQGKKPGQKPGQGQKGQQSGQNKQQGGKQQSGQQSGQQGQNGKNGENSNTNQKGEDQNAEKPGLSEEMSSEIFEIYKQQQDLRNQLEDKIKELGLESQSQNLERSLDQLEEDMLLKGFSSDVLKQMQNIKHQLLKLEKAAQQQGQDDRRQATTHFKDYQNNKKPQSTNKAKEYFETFEILNRQQLPLQNKYKVLINKYFDESANQL